MYTHGDNGNGGLIIVAIIILVALLFAADDSEPTTYWHARVNEVVMPIGHDCEFGVLYNQEGQVMEDLDGLNIECKSILLTTPLWKMTPVKFIKENIVDIE